MLDVSKVRFHRSAGVEFTYDFSVAAGEILAVQGISGAGKTTLLDLIAGFETPQTGRISWNDEDFIASPPWERPVTTVFQANNLFAHLTCRRNVEIALSVDSGTSISATEIDKAFARLSIDGLQERLPDQISGGQQQRVALVRAMLRNRPILLLDESFSALDWPTRTGCFDALIDLAQARSLAVVIVSHDERDAAYLECRVLELQPPHSG